jgi:hypothetical protein
VLWFKENFWQDVLQPIRNNFGGNFVQHIV